MNFLIVEDDNIQLVGLKHIIEEEYSDSVVYTAPSYDDAVSIIDSYDIDIFLLDINLGKGKTGLDVCGYIRGISKYSDVPVIFITDITVPNIDVINKYHCQYYFSKPYDKSDVINGINSVSSAPESHDTSIQLKDIQGILFHIYLDDIIYVCATGHHKHIFTSTGDFIVTNPSFKAAFFNESCDDTDVINGSKDSAALIRCHKSCYINPTFIQSYDRSNALISLNGIQELIPVGRKYKTYIEYYLENRS